MGTRTGFTDDRERGEGAPPSKGVVRDLAETVLICFIFILFLRTFTFQQSEIPSGSMETTVLIGDHVLVNRFLYAPTSFDWERRLLPIRPLRRGDVVVFKQPDQPEVDFIKRVVGLPGDIVELREGYLHVNDVRVDEPYVQEEYRQRDRNRNYGPVEVLPDNYLMFGDHRDRSQDSRKWGQVPRRLIKGRAFMILFSTNAEPPQGQPPGQVSPTSLVRKLWNLAFRSRWERWLSLIR